MNTQNYKKNIASYCDVVNAGRITRRLALLAHDLDRLIDQLAVLIGDSKIPKEATLFRSEVWSIQLKAEKKYRKLYDEHFRMLNES